MGEPNTVRRVIYLCGIIGLLMATIGPVMWFVGRYVGLN